MDTHQRESGIEHEKIMVFPQGVFSGQAMQVLKSFNFLAAVNTEIVPQHNTTSLESLPLSELLDLAITKYDCFPLFSRRKSTDDLLSYAMDIFLGKPCLIVTHHGDFKNDSQEVIGLINLINKLDPHLRWADLGTIVRGSYLWRSPSNESVAIKMFANELILVNRSDRRKQFSLSKPESDSSCVRDLLVNNRRVDYDYDGNHLKLSITIKAKESVRVQIVYRNVFEQMSKNFTIGYRFRSGMRRQLCDFRDNYLMVWRHKLSTSLRDTTQDTQ